MRASVGTGVVLMAVGGVLSFAVTDPPDQVERYLSVFDLGLVLIWVGVLTLVMQVVMHRPRRARPSRRTRDQADWPTDEHDVHRAGYAGQTRRLPTVRGRAGER
jgi:hypothetical protein